MLLLQLERINEDKTGSHILPGRVIDYLINVWREHN